MKIFVIWGESISKPGAGTVHFTGLVRGFARCGHKVTAIVPGYAGLARDDHGTGAKFLPLPRRGKLSFILLQLLLPILMPWWLIRHRPDVVYVRTFFLQGLAGLICRLARIPIVGEVDGLVDREIIARGQPRLLASAAVFLDRLNNVMTSGQVCVSKGLKDEMIRRGAREKSTLAVHNGASSEIMVPADRREARQKLGLPQDARIAGFAGTFAPWQGLDMLLEAAGIINRDKSPEFRIALAGDGQMREQLHQTVREKGLDGMFIFLPPMGQQDVAVFLSACDVSVIPIHSPGKLGLCSPLKFYDSISIGLPTVVPKGLELENELASLDLPGVFDPQSPASLAEAIIQALEKADGCREKRQLTHSKVKSLYSWDVVAGKVADFLAKLKRR